MIPRQRKRSSRYLIDDTLLTLDDLTELLLALEGGGPATR